MRTARSLVIAAVALALSGCPSGEEEDAPRSLEEAAAEKCPRVHMDRMEGDWIVSSGDAKTRLRILPEGDGYTVWYVGGFFNKYELDGVKRESDVQLTEVPRGMRKHYVDEGQVDKVRLYLRPILKTCSLKLEEGVVSAEGKELIQPPSKAKEFLPFPESGAEFTYRPADEHLFLGEAARSKRVADKQLADLGGPNPEIDGSTAIPVGTWSVASEDGDPSCTYDMDLYFDDQPVPGKQKVPAGEVQGEHRHWFHAWDADWSFNHMFEIYRYRTCGGERELIAVAGIEAILG